VLSHPTAKDQENETMTVQERSLMTADSRGSEETEDWVRRSQSGDLNAFDRLVERYYRVIFNLAFRMLGNRERAEDAAQEIFYQAWRGIGRFRGASQFSTWLHSIAVRRCIDLSQNVADEASRTLPLDEWNPSNATGSEADGERTVMDWHRSQCIREALAKLPEKLRVVIVLRFYSDYTAKEIAAALSLPLRTVYSRLEIGLSRLERDLKGLESGS
jgi:RNA polymerase sigma-70 factor (ECF subfamily)